MGSTIYCTIHSSIQIKRRKRNGEWLQLMKECPLCTADDNASEWSNVTFASTSSGASSFSSRSAAGGNAGSSRSSGSSTASFRLQQQSKNKRVRQTTTSTSFSKSKECKDDEPSISNASMDEAIDCEGEPNDREFSDNITALPFVSNANVLPKVSLGNDEQSDPGDKLLFQHRREKISELKKKRESLMHHSSSSRQYHGADKSNGKGAETTTPNAGDNRITTERADDDGSNITRIVPPSQRHQNFNMGSTKNSAVIKASNGSIRWKKVLLHEDSQDSGTGTNEQRRQLTKNNSHGKQISHSIVHSEPMKHESKTKNNCNASNNIWRSVTKHTGCRYGSNTKNINDQSTLEVSYDPFCAPNGLKGFNSDDVTVVTENTSLTTRIGNDYYEGNVVVSEKEGNEENKDASRRKQDSWPSSTSPPPPPPSSSHNVPPSTPAASLRHLLEKDDGAGSALGSNHIITMQAKTMMFENMARKWHSLSISSKRGKARESPKLVEADDIKDVNVVKDSPCDDDGRVNPCLRSTGVTKGQKPSASGNRISVTFLKQPSYHSKPYQSENTMIADTVKKDGTSKEGLGDSDVNMTIHNASKEEGLGNVNMTFRNVVTPSPKGRERKKVVVLNNDGMQEEDKWRSDPSTWLRSESPAVLGVSKNKSDNQSGTTCTKTKNTKSKPFKEGNIAFPARHDGNNSSSDSGTAFNKCDSEGRCIHHPHIQLRTKQRLGGWKKGRWKMAMLNCTECCFEEVQRLKLKNSRSKENIALSRTSTQPSSSSSDTSSKGNDKSTTKSLGLSSSSPGAPINGYDTSTTASMSLTSSLSNNTGSIDLGHQVKGILRKQTLFGDTSDFNSSSRSIASRVSSLSSNTDEVSSVSSSLVGSRAKRRPQGILRRSSSGSVSLGNSRDSLFRKSSSPGNSGGSNDSRVAFVVRDHTIDPT